MWVSSPGWLSASIRPPWASTMVCAIERPRPLPDSSTSARRWKPLEDVWEFGFRYA